tara:strand:- start:183 stop:575 length:393 start_codon:yes stop_codon:yes gene_type:complete
MLTWLAVKTAWASFLGWCKERWELLVGVVVGVLGMLALTRSSRDAGKVIEEKNKLRDVDQEAQAAAREAEDEALKQNLESFLERNSQAKEEFAEKIKDLDDETKARVKELLESDDPEDKIAQGLRDYLGQ